MSGQFDSTGNSPRAPTATPPALPIRALEVIDPTARPVEIKVVAFVDTAGSNVGRARTHSGRSASKAVDQQQLFAATMRHLNIQPTTPGGARYMLREDYLLALDGVSVTIERLGEMAQRAFDLATLLDGRTLPSVGEMAGALCARLTQEERAQVDWGARCDGRAMIVGRMPAVAVAAHSGRPVLIVAETEALQDWAMLLEQAQLGTQVLDAACDWPIDIDPAAGFVVIDFATLAADEAALLAAEFDNVIVDAADQLVARTRVENVFAITSTMHPTARLLLVYDTYERAAETLFHIGKRGDIWPQLVLLRRDVFGDEGEFLARFVPPPNSGDDSYVEDLRGALHASVLCLPAAR